MVRLSAGIEARDEGDITRDRLEGGPIHRIKEKPRVHCDSQESNMKTSSLEVGGWLWHPDGLGIRLNQKRNSRPRILGSSHGLGDWRSL